MNHGKVILSLCDFTGNWPRPYAEAGYQVVQVDLKRGDDVRLFAFPGHVHGILAAPPCTAFAGSGAQYWKKKDASGETLAGLALVDACLRFVAICRPSWWVLENPVGRLRRWLGPPTASFHPHEFGGWALGYRCGCGHSFAEHLGKHGCPNCEGDHEAVLESADAYTKKTLLWGNFTPPPPEASCAYPRFVARLMASETRRQIGAHEGAKERHSDGLRARVLHLQQVG